MQFLIILFRIKSALILKKNLIANLSTIKIFLKTKTKPYGDEATDFHDKEIPRVGFNHTCLGLMNLDSALQNDKNYYPQVFLKECKYIKKVIRHITDDLRNSSDSEPDEE